MEEALFSTHHDLEHRHWWFRARRKAIRELGLPLLDGEGTVVDVGCGTGADIASFPERYDRHGIDISPTAIEFARESYPGIQFHTGAVPEAGSDIVGSADLVLLCDVLEHIEDDVGFLSSLIAMMRPGASLLLTVPADPRLWSPHDEVYEHFRRYTRSTLAATWADSPADTRLLAPLNRRLYPLVRAVRAASALGGRGIGSESSDLALPWGPVNAALERVFAGEVPALAAALESGRREVPGRGVSLLAVLRRTGAAADAGTAAESVSESTDA